MEDLIKSLSILFALSLIVEQIDNCLKLMIIDKCDKCNWLKNNRKLIIQLLSICGGITIAFITKTDIFSLLLNKSTNCNCSYIITGIFLSFGSKFFHDLIGIVYNVKNIKEELKKINKDN